MANPGMYPLQRHTNGEPKDQEVHGLHVTWNPDDNRFYVHGGSDTNVINDMAVLGTFKDWRNVVTYCRRKSQKV